MPNPSDKYKDSKQYKYKYLSGRREPPKQCPILKKNGERCKNSCMVPYNVCKNHGGYAAKKKITHGTYSKLTRQEDMLKIKGLTKVEEDDLLLADYSKDEILDTNIKLSHLQINRLVQLQSQLNLDLTRARKQYKDLQDVNASFKEVEVVVKRIETLIKEISNTSKIIQAHQNNWNLTLKAKKELREKAESDELLLELQATLGDDPEHILKGLMTRYLQANPGKSVEDIMLLPPASNEYEEIDVDYSEIEDD